jgi:GT2 family glycosyltransferase
MQSLEALFAQDFQSSRFEIIVVVDGSSDGTAAALRTFMPACRFRVIEQENRGPAGARNAGYRAAESDLVLFVDDDMRCDPELLTLHVRAHRRFAQAVIFGSLFLTSDSSSNLASECFRRELGAFHLRHVVDPSREWKMTDCIFSNASMPRDLLLKMDGFDEQFRMREDLELGIRLRKAGIRMEYVKDAIAYQYYNKTASDLLADAEAFGAADALFAKKHPDQILEGHLRWLESSPSWKKKLRALIASQPVLERLFLAPCCYLGDRLFRFSMFRMVGTRALQMRRRIHWLRGVQHFMEF